MEMVLKRILLYIPWAVAVAATVGSLYFSEVLLLPPCVLCWYQRVFMYPLVVVIAVGILRKDKDLPFYVLPLSFLGMGVSFYQSLLQWGVIPETIGLCTFDTLRVSCTIKYIEWFGFVTIPFLSFLAFMIISVCMTLLWKLRK